MDKAEPALGREGGRAEVPPRAVALLGTAVPEDPAPRGPWERETNLDVGFSWLDTSLWLPVWLHFNSTSHRAGEEWSSEQIPTPSFSRDTSGLLSLPWQKQSHGLVSFHSCCWKSDAKIEAVPKSLLCVTLPMELLQARGWLLLLGYPCSIPVPSQLPGIYQHHVASLRKSCSFPKLFQSSE